MSSRKVRVRFAPSPTGPLHIGGVRTALFNYLFAKKHNGDFLLRIEDTDMTRYVPGAEDYIIESLKWCNILPNEGVSIGGPHAPYRQSERKDIYHKYAEQLVNDGFAYYAFDTPEELEAMREKLKAEGNASPQYDSKTRGMMKNSLTMAINDVKNLIGSGKPFVIRFKVPEDIDVIIQDLVRGEVIINTSIVDDKVLFKSDGLPTYHLANVVDDYLMQITHVIRGEEWLPSTPLHVLMYNAFGWQNEMPKFAHLPLLLKPSGQGKLSKRDGDQLGFPVFPLQWTDPSTGEVSSGYRESGYFSEAFINLLAFLGWNPGTEQEIFTLDEMAQVFDLERVGKAGARFDPEKAKWFNHQYLIKKSNEELCVLYKEILFQKGIQVSESIIARICGLIKDRAHFVSEFWGQSSFFFVAPDSYDEKVIKKHWTDSTPATLQEIKSLIVNAEDFTAHTLENSVKTFIESKSLKLGQVFNVLRLCLVGSSMGPHLFDIMEIIGKEEVIKRIDTAIAKIKS